MRGEFQEFSSATEDPAEAKGRTGSRHEGFKAGPDHQSQAESIDTSKSTVERPDSGAMDEHEIRGAEKHRQEW